MNEYFRAVAIDYDGTLADHDAPSTAALEAIAELRAHERKVILVTGRILEELRSVFPDVDARFDALVVENGAVMSVDGATRTLAAPVEFELDEGLVARAVPFRRGQVLLATQEAHESAILEEIRRLGLECQLTRNRGELMLLPPGISKGFGTYQALAELGVSHHSAIGIGDGENDHSLLRTCELGVAVANAVEGLKRHADVVLEEPGGEGLAGFLRAHILHDDVPVPTQRWRLDLGTDLAGARVDIPGSRVNLLVTGRSKSGKSFLTGLLAEQLIGLGYSVCIIDPEGDYAPLGALRGVLALGGREPLPPPEQIGRLIEHRFGSVLVDLSLVDTEARWAYADQLIERLEEERRATGLPHWIICDEAHDHLATNGGPLSICTSAIKGYCIVTYEPGSLDEDGWNTLDRILLLPGGKRTDEQRPEDDPIAIVSRRFGLDLAGWDSAGSGPGRHALMIDPGSPPTIPPTLRAFEMSVRRRPHVRHWHKYVEGRLPERHRFGFRTGTGELRAEASNIRELHRALRSCTDDVLLHHAVRGDLSRWLRDVIQDAGLARTVRSFEQDLLDSKSQAAQVGRFRRELVDAVEHRYLE